MNREFKFELQKVEESGEFFGVAAVYGNVDLGGDILERGSLTKTIADNGGSFPLLADHRVPIGIAHVSDSEVGLMTRGLLNLEKQAARDIHSDLKFYHSHNKPYGMSIGYDPVKKKKDGDFRILKEVRLVEISTTLFPMNPLARISDVKSTVKALLASGPCAELKRMMDFDESLDASRTWALRYQMYSALGNALDSIVYDGQASREDKLEAIERTCQQFMDAYLENIPRFLDLMDGTSEKAARVEALKSSVALQQQWIATLLEAAAPQSAEPGPALHSVADMFKTFKVA